MSHEIPSIPSETEPSVVEQQAEGAESVQQLSVEEIKDLARKGEAKVFQVDDLSLGESIEIKTKANTYTITRTRDGLFIHNSRENTTQNLDQNLFIQKGLPFYHGHNNITSRVESFVLR